jgi:4-hydroxy-tetrahydrodipicolinate reductase
MGQAVVKAAANYDICNIIAGVDINPVKLSTFPVYSSLNDVTENSNILIDFSHPSGLEVLLNYAASRKLPTVIATTGLSQRQHELIADLSKQIPIFCSANMSIGVNLLINLVKKAAAVLSDSFDIEIIEKHHNQKLDAPSGTAIMLADAVSSVVNPKPEYVHDRHSYRRKRSKNEIGIHAVRGGTIVGEHEVIFAGNDEIIELSHSAMSREIFAAGAIKAALFLYNKPAGLYNMDNLVDSL